MSYEEEIDRGNWYAQRENDAIDFCGLRPIMAACDAAELAYEVDQTGGFVMLLRVQAADGAYLWADSVLNDHDNDACGICQYEVPAMCAAADCEPEYCMGHVVSFDGCAPADFPTHAAEWLSRHGGAQ